jgi:nucleoside phosphorylase/tetratricopeptide (TPR) repeat protein
VTYGPDDRVVAVTLNHLGLVARLEGDLTGARRFQERALRIFEAAYGPDHHHVARTLAGLGNIARLQGDLAEARWLLERALRVKEAAYGPDHPEVAFTLGHLGLVAREQGDLAEARRLQERALRVDEAAYGPDHPHVASTLNNLGVVARDQGDLAEARRLTERALGIFWTFLGEEHPDTVKARDNLRLLDHQPVKHDAGSAPVPSTGGTMTTPQAAGATGAEGAPPKVLLSYSWDDDAHTEWVRQLATRLRGDGVAVTLDRWHAAPGDQLPEFMERAVRENDFVVAVCTPRYKERFNSRGGGVGYEGDIMTAEVFTGGSQRKFIPVLRRGSWTEAAPSWLLGKFYIDLSGDPYSEMGYETLLRTLHGAIEAAPTIGRKPDFNSARPVMGVGPGRAEGPGVDPATHEGAMSQTEAQPPTVGIITALPHESAAVRTVLGEPPRIDVPGSGAGRIYWMGDVPSPRGGSHRVVVAEAGMGNNVAAIRASLLLSHFPTVRSIIMCGIAGGVPNPDKPADHVRLGDIIVSNIKGVVQYDFVKRTVGRKRTEVVEEVRSSPHRPSAELLEAVQAMASDEHLGNRPWERWLAEGLDRLHWTRPDAGTDILAGNDGPLPHPPDPKRREGLPRVFLGPIASANTLLKDPVKRDALGKQFGVKAVEMEGSGVTDATWTHGIGYLVVRGICDYCDASKNDTWQNYAATGSAAYVRALLEAMPGTAAGDTGQRERVSPVERRPDLGAQNTAENAAPATGPSLRERGMPVGVVENIDDQLRAVLRPLMTSEHSRQARLSRAFAAYPGLLDRIDTHGETGVFLSHLLQTLRDYGEVAPSRRALAVLLESIRDEVGAGDRNLIVEILRALPC